MVQPRRGVLGVLLLLAGPLLGVAVRACQDLLGRRGGLGFAVGFARRGLVLVPRVGRPERLELGVELGLLLLPPRRFFLRAVPRMDGGLIVHCGRERFSRRVSFSLFAVLFAVLWGRGGRGCATCHRWLARLVTVGGFNGVSCVTVGSLNGVSYVTVDGVTPVTVVPSKLVGAHQVKVVPRPPVTGRLGEPPPAFHEGGDQADRGPLRDRQRLRDPVVGRGAFALVDVEEQGQANGAGALARAQLRVRQDVADPGISILEARKHVQPPPRACAVLVASVWRGCCGCGPVQISSDSPCRSPQLRTR